MFKRVYNKSCSSIKSIKSCSDKKLYIGIGILKSMKKLLTILTISTLAHQLKSKKAKVKSEFILFTFYFLLVLG